MDLGGLPLAVGRRMIRRKAHSNSVGTATKGNQSGSPHPRQLPPISLLVITLLSWGWSRVPILNLLEMTALFLDDGSNGFFFRLFSTWSITKIQAGMGFQRIYDGSCFRPENGQFTGLYLCIF